MPSNRPKRDDRTDNVEKLQNIIDNTVENIHEANQRIEMTNSAEVKAEIKAKNKRREQSLQSLREEIVDEAHFLNDDK